VGGHLELHHIRSFMVRDRQTDRESRTFSDSNGETISTSDFCDDVFLELCNSVTRSRSCGGSVVMRQRRTDTKLTKLITAESVALT